MPDLILTKGAIIRGTVTNPLSQPVPGAGVAVYDPARPQSSAAVDGVKADPNGHYRLRVAPGSCCVYRNDGHGNASENITVSAGEVATVDLKTP